MIEIREYTKENNKEWNDFNKDSKNSLFMFDRQYMDYHSDRFEDHSLMFYRDNELISLLPLSKKKDVLYSHAGLTFGGFISGKSMKQHMMNESFEVLVDYCKGKGFSKMVYKTIPHIYHNQPAEEDRYSLYADGAKLVTVDASTFINLKDPIKMPKGRKSQISRAKRSGVEIKALSSLDDFNKFIKLENEVLSSRYGVQAVHTGQELKMLHDRFPENICLYASLLEGRLIAGVVVYIYEDVIHTQYMAANDEARTIGALDLAVATVIDTYKQSKLWLDFGISTEHDRIYLNEGLIAQKEGFGGRTGVYEIWELDFA